MKKLENCLVSRRVAYVRMLYVHRGLRKFGTAPVILANFCRFTVESILSRCITAWYAITVHQDYRKLQRVMGAAPFQHLHQPPLPP